MKTNEMQICGEGIENLLVNIVLEFFFKTYKFEETPFHTSLLGNGPNIFLFGIIQVTTYNL
jgi:hypothetical protein